MSRGAADARFAGMAEDPRFKTLPQKATRTKVDPRFNRLFTEKEKFDHAQDLFEKEESEESVAVESEGEEEVESSVEEEEVESQEEEAEPPRAEAISRRLALQNYDWQQLKAKDLFILFESLAATEDTPAPLKSVKVFISDFGEQRLKEEEARGPVELLNQAKAGKDDLPEIPKEALRRYEANRLKYYFAVVEFVDESVAEKVYDEFDGVEFEFTGFQLDLRFVPEGTKIPKKPVQVCTKVDEKDRQESKVFAAQALAHSNVKLTWERPDQRDTSKLFNNDKLKTENVKDLVNVDDSEDEEPPQPLHFEVEEPDFGDFAKNKRKGPRVLFKAGFGEKKSGEEEQATGKREYNPFKGMRKGGAPTNGHQEEKPEPDSKKRKSRKELIREAQQKKKNRRAQAEQDNAELGLLVDQSGTKGAQTGDSFKADLKDPRFAAVLGNPRFQIDATHPEFQKDKHRAYLEQRQGKRVKPN